MSAVEFPAGVVEPTGQRITMLWMRGRGPVLVDEIYEDFVKRFAQFMNEEHTRGDQFHYVTFYSWDAEVNRLHFKHIKREPACLTLDGCREIDEITPEYIQVEPLEIQASQSIALPFQRHGPGKRR